MLNQDMMRYNMILNVLDRLNYREGMFSAYNTVTELERYPFSKPARGSVIVPSVFMMKREGTNCGFVAIETDGYAKTAFSEILHSPAHTPR